MSSQHSEDFLHLAAEAKKQIKELTPAEALRLAHSGALLLDVLEKEEFAAGHLPFATHLSRGLLETKANEVAPNKAQPIICYCSGGNRGTLLPQR